MLTRGDGYDAALSWRTVPGAVAYRIVWRDGWELDWSHSKETGTIHLLLLVFSGRARTHRRPCDAPLLVRAPRPRAPALVRALCSSSSVSCTDGSVTARWVRHR